MSPLVTKSRSLHGQESRSEYGLQDSSASSGYLMSPFSSIGMGKQMMSSHEPLKRKDSKGECIHSGHFMISELDEAANEVPKESTDRSHDDYDQQDLVTNEGDNQNLDDLDAQEVRAEFKYGDASHPKTVAIDNSLSKLLQCMSIAYSGKLTSPKWKSFKGLRLKVKDKIRLNNIIWRCWHMQYIQSKKPPVCQFATTIDVHNKPEAVLLEGKYWKRGKETVTAEYNKWRKYHKEKQSSCFSVSIFLLFFLSMSLLSLSCSYLRSNLDVAFTFLPMKLMS